MELLLQLFILNLLVIIFFVLLYLIIFNRYAKKLLRLLWSLLKSIIQGVTHNHDVKKFVAQYPRFFLFLRARWDKTKFSGRALTLLSISFFYVASLILGVTRAFIYSDPVLQIDQRTANLLFAFRDSDLIKIFSWVTLLGSSKVIIFFLVITSIIFWLRKNSRHIYGLILAVVCSEAFTFFGKNWFERPRPSVAYYLEDSFSFPSGHATAAVAFYGFVTYYLLYRPKSLKRKNLILFLGITTIFAIGFSRLYLGVHYLSDVWSGYLIGLFWLVISISVMEWMHYHSYYKIPQPTALKPYVKKLTMALIAFGVLGFIVIGLIFKPKLNPNLLESNNTIISSSISNYALSHLPKFTQTLDGATQEPLSLVILAKDDGSLIQNMAEVGWNLADAATFGSVYNTFKAAIKNKDYDTAPMTPSFWNDQVHKFGFEKSTAEDTARQRHHARIWKTNLVTSDEKQVYVGTVSLDTGIKWLITHRISPDIDSERELLFGDLGKSGKILSSDKIQLVEPTLGKNFTGDQFFTDGRTYVINLK